MLPFEPTNAGLGIPRLTGDCDLLLLALIAVQYERRQNAVRKTEITLTSVFHVQKGPVTDFFIQMEGEEKNQLPFEPINARLGIPRLTGIVIYCFWH